MFSLSPGFDISMLIQVEQNERSCWGVTSSHGSWKKKMKAWQKSGTQCAHYISLSLHKCGVIDYDIVIIFVM